MSHSLIHAAAIPFTRHIPFVQTLGFELLQFGGGHAAMRYSSTEAHTNSYAVAHGGVLMTLLDVVMAHAARSLDPSGPSVVTIEMKTSFMKPATGMLMAQGQMMHRSSTMAFTEGWVEDSSGARLCHATATFKFMKSLPVERQIHSSTQAAQA